jgi:hypothetical protein
MSLSEHMNSFDINLGGKTIHVDVFYKNPFEKASLMTIERHTREGVLSDTFFLVKARLTGEKVIVVEGIELLAVVRDKNHLERVLKNHILPLFKEEDPEAVTVILS